MGVYSQGVTNFFRAPYFGRIVRSCLSQLGFLVDLLAGMNLDIVFGLKAVEANLYTGELTVDGTYI